MTRQTESAVMSVESLYWVPDPLRDQDLSGQMCLWPVFFKIDGATTQICDQPGDSYGKLIGTASADPTTGTGRLQGTLAVNQSLPIPAEIGEWNGQVQPIPVGPALQPAIGTDFPGIFGVLAVVLAPGALEADALVVGHIALNDSVKEQLDNLIDGLKPFQQMISQGQIDAAVKAIGDAVDSAIHAALDTWDKIKEKFFDTVTYGHILAYYTQDDLPPQKLMPGEVNQVDFTPTSPWAFPGTIGVDGAYARARRDVGQGILSHFGSSVRAVAGYADPAFQHAIVATDDGNVTEIWWQGPGGPGQGTLSHFTSGIVALAGYYSGDGYQNVIVGTDDRTVSQLWWQGSGGVGRGVLVRMNSAILAVAGYHAESYHNVMVATSDGNVSQLWWQGGASPGQGVIAHFDSKVVDLTGYEAADGYEHVFVATADGKVTELYWQGPMPAARGAQLQLEANAWNNVAGLGGYYAAADGLQHVVAGTTNGTLREFFWSPRGEILHDDLMNVSVMVPVIDAYYDPSGYQHAIVGTKDGDVHEVYWTSQTARRRGPGPGPIGPGRHA